MSVHRIILFFSFKKKKKITTEKELKLRPLFYNAKCYCRYERLFLCQKDVKMLMFLIKGHATMAANKNITDPPPHEGQECFDLKFKRDI